MATTHQAQPTKVSPKSTGIDTRGYAAQSATAPLEPFSLRAPRAGSPRRADRHPLLRRLPLRPAPGPQRVAGHHVSHRAGARDRRPGERGGRRGHQLQGRRRRGRRLHGRLLPAPARLPRRARAVLRERHRVHLQQPGQHGTAARPTAATPSSIVVDETLRAAHPRQAGPRPRPRRCCAPASPRTRRCATGRWARAQKVGVVGLGGLGHMGVKLAHAMGAHVVLFTTSPGKKEDAQRLGAARGRGLEEIADELNAACRAASTSSSTRSRRRTISTPTSAAQARRDAVPGRRAASTRIRRPARSRSS